MAGIIRLEMSDPRQQVRAGPAVDGRGPADDVRAPADSANTCPSRSGPGWRPPSTRHPWAAPGCSAADGAAMPSACSLCRRAACWHAGQVSGPPVSVSRGKIRSMRRDFADIDRPEGAADGGEVLRVADLLVAKKLRPGAVRRVAEVVGQLAGRVPPAGGLRRILPQKGKAGIGVAIGDHVAGDDANARASSRTLRGPSSSGDHSSPRVCAGVLPSSRSRGRSNQRRTPMSLYAPAKSPATKARK